MVGEVTRAGTRVRRKSSLVGPVPRRVRLASSILAVDCECCWGRSGAQTSRLIAAWLATPDPSRLVPPLFVVSIL